MAWYYPGSGLSDSSFQSGRTNTGFQPQDYIYGCKITLPAGEVTRLSVKCRSSSGSLNLKVGLYNSSGTLLGQTTATALADGGDTWRDTGAISINVTAGDYFVMSSAQTGLVEYNYDSSGDGSFATEAYATALAASETISDGAETGKLFGVKADLTPGGTAVAQASETDSAQPMGVSQPPIVGRAAEANEARAIATVDFAQDEDLFYFGDDEGIESSFGGLRLFGGFLASGSFAALAQAFETDLAQALAAFQRRVLGQATEANAAQPVGGGSVVAVSQAQEANSALQLAAAQARGVGQAAESDAAQPVVGAQARVIGQAAEANLAQPLAVRQSATLGQAAETDLAQALASAQARALGQAAEADSAQPVSASLPGSIGIASEADAAQALAAAQTRGVGQAAEVDTAQATDVIAAGSLGLAAESNTAQPLAAAQRKVIAQAQETDAAQPVQAAARRQIGLATEADGALPLGALQIVVTGLAAEIDAALGLAPSGPLQIGQAAETDQALALTLAAPFVTPARRTVVANTSGFSRPANLSTSRRPNNRARS